MPSENPTANAAPATPANTAAASGAQPAASAAITDEMIRVLADKVLALFLKDLKHEHERRRALGPAIRRAR